MTPEEYEEYCAAIVAAAAPATPEQIEVIAALLGPYMRPKHVTPDAP